MPTLHHPYFGTLNSDTLEDIDVIWETTLGEPQTHSQLWAAPEQRLDTAELDAFAALLQNLPTLDKRARAALCDDLANDGSFLEYFSAAEALEYDVEELRWLKPLLNDIPAFVAALQLTAIGLWTRDTMQEMEEEPATPLVLDYKIAPEHTDQILAVKCDLQGNIISIDWES